MTNPANRLASTNQASPAYPEPTLEGVEAWLAQMPEVYRARLLGVLASTTTNGRLSKMRQATVYELTRGMTDAEAAKELDVSPSAVRNLVSAYCKAHPEAPRKHVRAPKDDAVEGE